MRLTCNTTRARGACSAGSNSRRGVGGLSQAPAASLPDQPFQQRARLGHSCLQRSHNNRLEVELAGSGGLDVQGAAAEAAAPGEPLETLYDCLGLAQAMVDIASAVDDDMLARLQVEKGSRR